VSRRTPTDIGTHTASAVVRYLVDNGFPHAERRALRGAKDAGDITGTPGICWEVKGGKAAKYASDKVIAEWLDEASEEGINAGSDHAILVTARAGVGEANCGRWWAWLECADLVRLASGVRVGAMWMNEPVRLQLHVVVSMLRDAGYGTPRHTAEVTA
jgi:hypothetical protein